MTREEMIAAVRECAAKLGRAPRSAEFLEHTPVSRHLVRKHFGTFTRMLTAAGVERRGPGCAVGAEALFADWATVARRLAKVPTIMEYQLEGSYSVRPFVRRYRMWGNVPRGLQAYAMEHGLAGEWEDVLKIIAKHLEKSETSARTIETVLSKDRLAGRPIYGRPMFGPFSFTPTNEQGVLFVFGAVAHELGFFISRVQTEFPDVEALREIGPNQCQRTTWELEYESRNFLTHMHALDGCDGIICWVHNWPECPLEVIELKSAVEKLVKRSGDRRDREIGTSGDRDIGTLGARCRRSKT